MLDSVRGERRHQRRARGDRRSACFSMPRRTTCVATRRDPRRRPTRSAVLRARWFFAHRARRSLCGAVREGRSPRSRRARARGAPARHDTPAAARGHRAGIWRCAHEGARRARAMRLRHADAEARSQEARGGVLARRSLLAVLLEMDGTSPQWRARRVATKARLAGRARVERARVRGRLSPPRRVDQTCARDRWCRDRRRCLGATAGGAAMVRRSIS